MNLTEFTAALHRMSAADVRAVARELDAQRVCAADDLAWWEATVDIERALKLQHRRREAAMAAHDATRAVRGAALAAGLTLPDDTVTRVARAAADVARGLAAGALADVAVVRLLSCWGVLLQTV